MPDDWNDLLGYVGIRPVEEDNLFGDLDEYGLLTPEAGLGYDEDDYGQMIVGGGFGNLYRYELSYKKKVRATKYAIPVIDKKRKMKAWRGDTPEQVIRQFEYGVAKAGDTETTFTSVKQADKYLEEGHGSFKQERWHVSKLTDLGPVSATAAPAQVSASDIQKEKGTEVVKAAQKASEAGKTEKEIMAMEKSFSPSEITKTGKNTIYIVAGVGAAVVIGAVVFLFYRHGTPVGALTGWLERRQEQRES